MNNEIQRVRVGSSTKAPFHLAWESPQEALQRVIDENVRFRNYGIICRYIEKYHPEIEVLRLDRGEWFLRNPRVDGPQLIGPLVDEDHPVVFKIELINDQPLVSILYRYRKRRKGKFEP